MGHSLSFVLEFESLVAEAGASLCHGHSQLLAVDRMPHDVRNVVERMQHHRAKTGCCLQCDLVRAEIKSKCRVVTQTESLVAYCPFASRLPMSIRITTPETLLLQSRFSPEDVVVMLSESV